MAVSEIKQISKSIRSHLEDLHLMMTHEQISIDTGYYNDVTMALLTAEDMILKANNAHKKRIQDHLDKYGPPNIVVD